MKQNWTIIYNLDQFASVNKNTNSSNQIFTTEVFKRKILMFWRILSPDFITGYSACVQLLRITKHVAKLRNSNISNDQKYKIVKGQIAVRITRQSNHFIISFILWPITWDYTLFVMYIISIMISALCIFYCLSFF